MTLAAKTPSTSKSLPLHALPGTEAPLPLLSVVTLVNDEDLYAVSRQTLEEQHPGQIQWLPIRADAAGWNATQGLNAGLSLARADWILCAHQDVLFPDGWWERAQHQLTPCGDRVAVAGLVGTTARGRFYGHVLDPRGHMRWGPLPARVSSIDEHAILLRRSSALRFDPATPGFHCYGTDLALSATTAGFLVLALDAPVVHLSCGRLDERFREASQWLVRKWGRGLGGVIPTPADVVVDAEGHSRWRWLCVQAGRRASTQFSTCRCGRFRRGADTANLGQQLFQQGAV